MKTTINVTLGLLILGIVGGVDMGTIGLRKGLMCIAVTGFILWLINKKKVRRTHRVKNRRLNKNNHCNYTSNRVDLSRGVGNV